MAVVRQSSEWHNNLMDGQRYTEDNRENFLYLFKLQKSGRTNMFGAAPYLESFMGLSKQEAREVLLHWMQNYESLAKELGVEI